MGIIQLRQIKDRLSRDFIPHLDLSDVSDAKPIESSQALSRAVAAFTLGHLAELTPAEAATTITDGYQDNGIDAIYYDKANKSLFLVQSKWNERDTGSIGRGDVQLFLQGVKDLLGSRRSKFNSKIQNRWAEIDQAITELRRLEIVVTYSGSGSFGTEPRSDIEAYLLELNDTGEIATLQIAHQPQLHQYLTAAAAGTPISLQVTLFDFGQTRDAIKAFYGQVAASDVASWYQDHSQKLFSKNIRMFLGESTQVNEQISKTLRDEPHHFWYLNNGITALANTVTKSAVGGTTKQSGAFECSGFTIVNGAQTVGAIASTFATHPEAVKTARVPLRIISLDEAPENFSLAITRANNTQNRIDAQNFVALDPQQHRIQQELAIDGISYEYRQSDKESSGPNRLGLQEATIALACTYSDIDLSTEAKREIGKLWEDISVSPYKLLFNGSLTGRDLWIKAESCRRLISAQQYLALGSADRSAHCLTHGNRFLLWLTYNRLTAGNAGKPLANFSDAELRLSTEKALTATVNLIDQLFPDSYIANVFKNRTKCREIAQKIPSL